MLQLKERSRIGRFEGWFAPLWQRRTTQIFHEPATIWRTWLWYILRIALISHRQTICYFIPWKIHSLSNISPKRITSLRFFIRNHRISLTRELYLCHKNFKRLHIKNCKCFDLLKLIILIYDRFFFGTTYYSWHFDDRWALINALNEGN